ncbi:RPP25 protein, partial [Amia calva]|nr:RPP25 protein [Amia calva]
MPPGGIGKLAPGNFKKVCKTEEQSPSPFPGLPPDVVEMRVKEGSKIRNLMGFAMTRMESGGSRQIMFSGSGRAVTKTITCVEIMKRKMGGLHQITKLRYKGLQEVWESQEEGPGQASEMTVHRNVPSVCILLSKDPLDPQEHGYQPPESLSTLWETKQEEIRTESPSPQCGKRPLSFLADVNEPESKRLSLEGDPSRYMTD